MLSVITLSAVLLCLAARYSNGFHLGKWLRGRQSVMKSLRMAESESESDGSFDPSAFEDALKKSGAAISNAAVTDKEKDDENTGAEKAEKTFREYPFKDLGLPVLADCDNYYSGKFGEYFWHQNADQLHIYIPVSEDMTRRDVKADFQASRVTFSLFGKEEFSFECVDRIIPDGSFWVFETDKDGKKYVQLDLEKRLRMINWPALFGKRDAAPKFGDNKTEMLQKLFSANKGMSKLTGQPPESIEEMMRNGELTKMLADELYPNETTSLMDEDGNTLADLTDDEVEELLDSVEEDDNDDIDGDVDGTTLTSDDDDGSVLDAEIVEE